MESLLDLYHEGRFCVDNNFKSGYLKVLETALETKLPGCGIKAKPHIESRIKTLKMQFRTLHDMLTGPNCRGFNWDPQRKIVTAEKAVWDAYIQVFLFYFCFDVSGSFLYTIFSLSLSLHKQFVYVLDN